MAKRNKKTNKQVIDENIITQENNADKANLNNNQLVEEECYQQDNTIIVKAEGTNKQQSQQISEQNVEDQQHNTPAKKREKKHRDLQKEREKQQKKQQLKETRLQKRTQNKLHNTQSGTERVRFMQKLSDEAFAKLSPDEQMDLKLESIAALQRNNKKWYKLDNAALMYPMIARGESPAVFRMAVQLKNPVDPITLQYAVNDICPRFPTITGTVVWGWFWPYIDKPQVPIVVKLQKKVPSRPIAVDAKRSQIRVNYYQNQIAVEFFHSATDGTGGLIFLNSLLRCYFERLGVPCDRTNCYDHRDLPTMEEMRDNFGKVAVRKNPPPTPPIIKSKVIKGTVLKNGKFSTIRGVCDANQLHAIAKEHNATVTEFLGAVQLLALDKLAKATDCRDHKPIRILIPINLRKLYDVETVRNFTSYIFYQYNGQSDIKEIIADIQQQTKQQFTDEYFRGMVSFNFNSGNHPLLKPVPAALKKLVVSSVVKGRGEGIVNCSTLSNVGVVKAPEQFKDLILRYEFSLGKPLRYTNCFSSITYNDVCVISMTTKYAERDCEKAFFGKLASLGVDIAVESDVWEEEQ